MGDPETETPDRTRDDHPRLIDPARFHVPPILDETWDYLRLDYTGIAVGSLFFCWSLTPSLLPRDWLFQGLIGGINAAIGYTLGTIIGWAVSRWLLRGRSWWPLPRPWNGALRVFVVLTSVLVSLVMLVYGAGWQREIARLMNMDETTTFAYIRTIAMSMLVAATIVAAYRVLREIARWIAGRLIRFAHLSMRTSLTIGVSVVVIVLVALVNGVLVRGTYSAVNNAFSLENEGTSEGVLQPTSPLRSGSDESFAAWDTLGLQGRNFVSRGLDAQELQASSGRPAAEPIRVYAGLDTAEDPDERMDVVIRELERTGAFTRSVLVVIPTTGTGWVNPTAAQAIELVHNGDSALVASQYSYLPSWISFVADRQKAIDAGKRLVDAVHARWLQEPEETRPKLLVYGESLGTQAGEGAFDSLEDIRRTVDGVLWVGPPNANQLWSSLVARRDPGTLEVDPVYAGGLVVRFANDREDIDDTTREWLSPRVLYIQHASDPVVWWTTDLLFERPDWLQEPPGSDRTPSMKWFPFVTFWQVSADLANAAGVPDGHGHNYGTLVLDGWVAIAQPEGWTPQDTERARATLEDYRHNSGPEK